jgi:HK97 family phage portal protein
MAKSYFVDGKKNVELWGDDPTGWTIYGNQTGAKATIIDLYSRVPWLFQAVNVRSNALASTPFVIYKEDKEIDNSESWKNITGIMPNPTEILSLLELSYVLYGRSYLLKLKNAAGRIVGLKYLQPETIALVYNDQGFISGYKRTTYTKIGGQVQTLYSMDDMIPFYFPDASVEQGYNEGRPLSPAYTALEASGVLAALDKFVREYFERGAIKATILTVKGNPNQDEKKRLKSWWTDMMTGIQNAFRLGGVFEADAVTPVIIGDGLSELSDNELTAQKRQDISSALGVPESMMWSAAANYATADNDTRQFYRWTVIPDCRRFEDTLNEYVFTPAGFHMEFTPESIDIFQQDEADRAGALAQLTNKQTSNIPTIVAMDILGYDITDDQRNAIIAANVVPAVVTMETIPPVASTIEPSPAARELDLYERKCLAAIGKGKPACVQFIAHDLDENTVNGIAAKLASVKSAEEARVIFARTRGLLKTPNEELTHVLDVLSKAIEK